MGTAGDGSDGTGGAMGVTAGDGGKALGGAVVIAAGTGATTGGDVHVQAGSGSTDGSISIGVANTLLVTVGAASNHVQVDGVIANNLVFEGATPDTSETTFAITDPTGDRTITFPDSTITVNAAGHISGTTLATNDVDVGGGAGSTGVTITSAGAITADGAVIAGSETSVALPGVAATTTFYTGIACGTGGTATLADGVAGQSKFLIAESYTSGNCDITPTNLLGGTSIRFTASSQWAHVVFGNGDWIVVALHSSAAVV